MSDFEQKYRTWHTWMSYLKSGIRILGCVSAVIVANPTTAIFALAFSFFLAELVGIAEEMV